MSLIAGLPHLVNRQHLYANLIYQHVLLSLRIGDYSELQIQNHLRVLFLSPLMREYWRAAKTARISLVSGTAEYHLSQVADDICQEYDSVVNSTGQGTPADPRIS